MSREKVYVIKVGGQVIDDETKLNTLLKAFAAIPEKKILVHGGGKLATDFAKKVGLVAQMVDGRRVTDEAMMEIVTMVYGGLVNKKIVAKLQALNCNATGATGADSNLITSAKRPIVNGVDYGWVGDPVMVDERVLQLWLSGGLVPVLAPLTHDGKGNLLNTNADTIAAEAAKAAAKIYDVSLVYTFELPGVLKDINDHDSLITHINATSFDSFKAEGLIHSGMIPKLEGALEAVGEGVSDVRISHFAAISKFADKEFREFTLITN